MRIFMCRDLARSIVVAVVFLLFNNFYLSNGSPGQDPPGHVSVNEQCNNNSTIDLSASLGVIRCQNLLISHQTWRLQSQNGNATFKLALVAFNAPPCNQPCDAENTHCDSIEILDGPSLDRATSSVRICDSVNETRVLPASSSKVAFVHYQRGTGTFLEPEQSRSFILEFEEKILSPPANNLSSSSTQQPTDVIPESKSSSDAKSVALGIAVGTAVLLMIALAVGFYCHYYRKKRSYRHSKHHEASVDEMDGLTHAVPIADPVPRKSSRSHVKSSHSNNGSGDALQRDSVVQQITRSLRTLSSGSRQKDDVIINDVVFDLPFDHVEIAPQQLQYTSEPIGIGSFGVIYQATYLPVRQCETPDGDRVVRQVVAVKKMRVMNEQYQQALEAELKLLTYIGPHTYICELIGAITEPVESFALVMEYCDLGSLQQFLANFDRAEQVNSVSNCKPPNINVGDLLLLAEQIANGMHFIHFRKCVHRDLAARNILLTAHRVPKIVDFGIARSLNPDAFFMTKHDGEYPWKWCAIEILEGELLEPRSDIWSFGVLMWEMFSLGRKPYSDVSRCDGEFIRSLKDGSRLPCPTFAPRAVYTLMLQCWRKIAWDRPPFAEIERALLSLRTSY